MNEIYVFATCRETAAAADGATWFQTFPPYGRYPVGGTIKDAPRDAEFVFNEASAKAVMDDFKALAKDAQWPGILVDEEHYSLDPSKSSAALAWAKDIRQEQDGSLWTRWEFTPRGRELWESKTLVNRSPAFACTKHQAPLPQTALQTREKALQNAGKRKDGQSPVQDETALKSKKNGVLESAIASIIAETFADELSKASQPPSEEDDEELANEITNPCPKCHRNMPKGGACTSCAKRAANHTAGKTAFAEVAKTHKDAIGAMERDSIGKIDFIWGDDSEGVCHIMAKHPADAQMIPGVIAYGDVYEDAAAGKYYCIKKRNLVVLSKGRGTNHYLITGYQKNDPKKVAEIRKGAKLVEKGE